MQTANQEQTEIDRASAAQLDFLLRRIDELKKKISESPEIADDYNHRIQCYEGKLKEILEASPGDQSRRPAGEKEKKSAESVSNTDSQPLETGEQAVNERKKSGEHAENHRSVTDDSPPADCPQLNPLQKRIAEELNHNSRSPLDKLSPERQEELFELLERFPVSSVLSTITLPPPTGWGIATSPSSLDRFRKRYAVQKLREQRRQSKTVAQEVLEDLDGADEKFATASERLLKLRLLETANDPQSKTRDLRDLFQTLIRVRASHQKSSQKYA